MKKISVIVLGFMCMAAYDGSGDGHLRPLYGKYQTVLRNWNFVVGSTEASTCDITLINSATALADPAVYRDPQSKEIIPSDQILIQGGFNHGSCEVDAVVVFLDRGTWRRAFDGSHYRFDGMVMDSTGHVERLIEIVEIHTLGSLVSIANRRGADPHELWSTHYVLQRK